MALVPNQPFDNLLTSDAPIPAWWISRPEQIEGFLEAEVDPQQLHSLATSPGGRCVRYVTCGPSEPHLHGLANFNSALGAGDPNAYCRRGDRRHPVLVILAGVHGAEVEGMMAALSALSIVETGIDLAGKDQAVLAEKLRRLRLIVIPLANPDGRARTPYDGWLGLPIAEMHRVSQGTRRDGTSYNWPACKAVHPMTGDVGSLGGYFDDAGVNLMHDEWSRPMSRTTDALLQLVGQEAPDMVLNCHSHEGEPAVLHTAYAPLAVREAIATFARRFYARLEEAGLPHRTVPEPDVEGPSGEVPPALNLTSMMYHVGAALPITIESPQGLKDQDGEFTYEQILQIHHLLLETAADWLLRPAGK
jgi:hypothetical protein